MEEKIIGEQPCENLDNVQSGIVEEDVSGTTCLNSQGSLGKFKDANSLLVAYNNLQAEFTRKCQKLSELEKSLEEKQSEVFENGEKNNADTNSQQENCDIGEKTNLSDKVIANLNSENSETKKEAVSKPIFESEDWKQKVSAFLNQNSEAKEYSGEIAKVIMEDKELQSSPYALELAWGKVLQKNYKDPKILAFDQNFINEKILSRDEIKEQVLNEYFKQIQNKKTPPLISSLGKTAGETLKEPTNMQEAKEAVARLFNLKGN